MKQEEQKNHLTGHNLKMKEHFVPAFIRRLRIPHEGAEIIHNEPIIVYLLLSSASDRLINQWWSHTGQRTMHTMEQKLVCDADVQRFDAALAGLEF